MTDKIFLSHATAPVVRSKRAQFASVFLSNKDNHLHLGIKGLSVSYDLSFGGIPVDIVNTDYGYAIYAISNTVKGYSFIIGLDFNYQIKFNKTIINNGENPTEIKDQITFYKESSVPEFGMEAMHEPLGGKLAYGRGRIALLFSHFNNFGAGTSERDDRSGDTFITFDENGEDVKYAWSWGASQSLTQSIIYDGRYFFTVSLSSSSPSGFRVCAIDVDETTPLFDPIHKKYAQHKSYCTDDLVPYVYGERETSSGRLGGLVQIDDKLALVYGVNMDKKISMVTFKFENGQFINRIRYPIQWVYESMVNLRASKYGNKIFIIYSTNLRVRELEEKCTVGQEDSTYYLLTSTTGKVTDGPFESKYNSINVSEDIKESESGALLWNYIASDGNLHSIFIEEPKKRESSSAAEEERIKEPNQRGSSSAGMAVGKIEESEQRGSSSAGMVVETFEEPQQWGSSSAGLMQSIVEDY